MNSQDKWLLGLRVATFLCIIVLFVAAVGSIAPDGVKAPLLTMMGGAAIVLALYPPRSLAVQDIAQDFIAIVGTGIAIFGGRYWFEDAIQNVPVDMLSTVSFLSTFLVLILFFYLLVSMLIVVVANWDRMKAEGTRVGARIRSMTRRMFRR